MPVIYTIYLYVYIPPPSKIYLKAFQFGEKLNFQILIFFSDLGGHVTTCFDLKGLSTHGECVTHTRAPYVADFISYIHIEFKTVGVETRVVSDIAPVNKSPTDFSSMIFEHAVLYY